MPTRRKPSARSVEPTPVGGRRSPPADAVVADSAVVALADVVAGPTSVGGGMVGGVLGGGANVVSGDVGVVVGDVVGEVVLDVVGAVVVVVVVVVVGA
jgi:hypothetical protein